MIGRLVNDVLRKQPPEYPWGDTLPIFHQVDWRMCNLECVISDKGTPSSRTPKVFHFRSDAQNIKLLEVARIDSVSLANNHVLDYRYEALFDLLRILDRADIKHAGAGINFKEAAKLSISEIGGIKIGVIAFTNNEPAWEATEEKAGVFYVPVDLTNKLTTKLLEIVHEAREAVDILVVSAHWGPNFGYRPQPHHIPFAHALVDVGGDIIFGHSCHVFQGIEIYRGKPILYSTGNFVDDYAVDEIERNDESFIFILEIEGKALRRLAMYPTIIESFQAHVDKSRRAITISTKMKRLCHEFKTEALWNEKKDVLKLDYHEKLSIYLDTNMTYKMLEHTADVRMLVQGDSLEELFSDAVFGMMEILKPKTDGQKQPIQRTIALEAADTTALLIDFLNEVLLSAHINKEMYDEVIFKTLSKRSLEVNLRGFDTRSFGEDIKAVTYHEADVRETKNGKWETMIVFDI